MSDRVAVYAGTKNIYHQMYTALKSLLLNNQMDRVYLLIEDDSFPYYLPGNVIPVNVVDQLWFTEDSPNYRNMYSYMTLMRCVLGELFEKEERILWLDCDTIVTDDITDLFTMNMDGYYYAGVMEPGKSKGIFTYINAGVLLCNLKMLRETCKELEIVLYLEQVPLRWLDQDAINLHCQGRLRLIGSEYNSNNYVMPCTRPKIIHYAAVPYEQFKEEWAWKRYEMLKLPQENGSGDDDG